MFSRGVSFCLLPIRGSLQDGLRAGSNSLSKLYLKAIFHSNLFNWCYFRISCHIHISLVTKKKFLPLVY